MKSLTFIHRKLEWIAAAVVVGALVFTASLDGRRAQAQQSPPNPVAYVPEVRIGTAGSVPIATAVSYFNSIAPSSDPATASPGTCDANAAERNPYVRELARSLPADAGEIFKYVHDNVSFSPTFGLKKGAAGAVLDGDGTAADQAQLLVELLRANGFCARYVFGTAEATLSQVQTWIGVVDLESAERVFADGGIPVERSASALKFAHVWVELYGASGNAAYDPSFKRRKPSSDAVDIATALGITNADLRTALGGSGDAALNRVFASTGGLDSYLTTKAQALAQLLFKNQQPASLPASMQSTDFSAMSFENVLGLGEMLPYGATPVTAAIRQPLAYTQTHQTWYQVPDRFKAMVTYFVGQQVGSATSITWHVKYVLPMEMAANGQVDIRTSFQGSTSSSAETGTGRVFLFFDRVQVAQTPELSVANENAPWFAAVNVNLPYAGTTTSGAGTYGDTDVVGRIDPRTYSTIFVASGETSQTRLREMNRLPRETDKINRAWWQQSSPALNNLMCPVPTTVTSAYQYRNYQINQSMTPFCNPLQPPRYPPPSPTNEYPDLQGTLPGDVWPGGDSCNVNQTFRSYETSFMESSTIEWKPCSMLAIQNMTPISVEDTIHPGLTEFSSGARTKQRVAVEWLVQNSQIRQAAAAVSGSVSQLHVVAGFATSQVEVDGYTNLVITDTLRLHAEPLISTNTRSNLAATAQAAARKTVLAVYSAAAAAAEGLVLRAALEQPFASSVADKFRWSIAFDSSTTTAANKAIENFRNVGIDPEGRFLRITPERFAQVGSAIWNDTLGYGHAARLSVESRLTAGYTAIIPKLGMLGPEMYPQQRSERPQGLSELEWYQTVYKGGASAVLLINPTTGAVSHLVASDRQGLFKGGSSAPELKANMIGRPSPEDNKAGEDPWSKLYQVDDRDGRLTFTVPGGLSLGAEGAGLEFQITYQSEVAATQRHLNGWTSNLHASMSLDSGALEHFGTARPAHAAAMLTAITAATVLYRNANDIDAAVGTEVAMGWWTDQLMLSSVTLTQGTAQTRFFRAPDGQFLAETPRGGALKQTGTIRSGWIMRYFTDPQQPGYAGQDNAASVSFRYEGLTVGFVHRASDGRLSRFAGGTDIYPVYPDPADVPFEDPGVPVRGPSCKSSANPGSALCDVGNGFGPLVLENQLPLVLKEIRTDCPTGAIDNVALCGGRTITFDGAARTVSDDLGNTLSVGTLSGTFTGRMADIVDATNRKLEFVYANRDIAAGFPAGDLLTGVRLKDTAGAIVWEYKFSYVNSISPNPMGEFRPLLEKVWLPHDHTNPYVTFAYTNDDRIDKVTRAGGKVYEYFATGRRTEVKDPLGNAAVNYFDANGRLFHAVDRIGRLNEYTHDGAGRVIERRLRMKTDPVIVYSERVAYKNDAFDNVTETTVYPRTDSAGTPMLPDSDKITTKAEYANAAFPLLPTKEIDALDRHILNAYDPYGRLTQVDGKTGERINTVYDTKGFVTSVRTYTSASVYRALDFSYTAGGQAHRGLIREASVYSSVAPSTKLTSSFAWDALGNLTQAADPRGHTKTAAYDPARRMTDFREYEGAATGTPKGRQAFVYDLSGRLLQVKRAKDAAGTQWATVTAEYTATGRVAKIKDPDLDEDVFGYDDRDWLSSAADGEGRVTGFTYDAAGRLTCEKRAVGTGLAQGYKSLGYGIFDTPARLRPAKGSDAECGMVSTAYDTTYAFDDFGRGKTTTFADGTTAQATLNVASEITAFKTRANQTLGYSYDASSRETARTTPQGAYAFAYDMEGKRTSASFTPSGGTAVTTSYAFDNYGRVTTEGRHDGKNIQYEYDGSGNRTAIVWPDGYRAEYVYDGLNGMIEVKAGLPGSIATIARYSYDVMGRRTQLAYGPTAGAPVSSITYAYEDDGDLVRLEHRFNSGATVKVVRHAFDKSGKLKSSAANDSAWAPLFPTGSPTSQTYAANALDQYTSISTPQPATANLTYDLNGNLTTDGTWTFAYDAENHLLSATKAGSSVTYTYDALGRRQTKTVNGTLTNYLSAGDEEIAEYDGSNNLLRRYIPGPGTDQPVAMVIVSGSTNTLRFFHADRQGSVVAMADAAGAMIEGPFTYDPYGGSTSPTTGVPFRYTGRRLDPETGLYYYRARYYSAALGRFLQTDPVGFDDQMNLYSYVGDSPVNFSDPTGETCDTLPNGELKCFSKIDPNQTAEERKVAEKYQPQFDQTYTEEANALKKLVQRNPDAKVTITIRGQSEDVSAQEALDILTNTEVLLNGSEPKKVDQNGNVVETLGETRGVWPKIGRSGPVQIVIYGGALKRGATQQATTLLHEAFHISRGARRFGYGYNVHPDHTEPFNDAVRDLRGQMYAVVVQGVKKK